MSDLATLRHAIAALHRADEAAVLEGLAATAPTPAQRIAAVAQAEDLIAAIRADSRPGLMEVFLAEYGLSTDEGVALMCLAEALLRVPDPATMDALIEDKIAPSAWGAHLGKSSSSLVNASTWALMLTGKVLKEEPGVAATLRALIKRLGEPVIRAAVARAMREMGQQFVLGQTIEEALDRGRAAADQGYTFSYDMLGEAALTAADAQGYFDAYRDAISALTGPAAERDLRDAPGISIKLSALHPRYEERQRDRVMAELVPRVLTLARAAKSAGMGLNIDAEEAARLELSLDVIEATLRDPSLAGWDGFGVVVQAYSKRAGAVIDWLEALAQNLDQRLMVRLVKGAYWDTEIKRAQVEGTPGFPVFTRKSATDVAYLSCAGKLLRAGDRLYPQFATHNAQTVAAILEMAAEGAAFEFQRLHGMGAALHDLVRDRAGTRCRIYAPVGAHRDLLAYLVRRLLENGANSSFVNQIVDMDVPAAEIAADPFAQWQSQRQSPTGVTAPDALYRPERQNAAGWDLDDPAALAELETMRAPFLSQRWSAEPLTAGAGVDQGPTRQIANPAVPDDHVGTVQEASADAAQAAIAAAQTWVANPADLAAVLTRAAGLYEDNTGEITALLAREAGKTLPDAVAELREAVDFLRYYGARALTLDGTPRGVIAAISPWNFPLAIFTGQIAGALAAGNAVVAKPAEATPLIAHLAVGLLHQAGVPRTALQLLPGTGGTVGAALTSDLRVAGVVFTGSTATAQTIHRTMAQALPPAAPLIAETGGLNAMIVDSTALPEQAVRDIIASAFQSAGQRCSALRMLYLQKDIAGPFLTMLKGAMDELRLGDPWAPATDIGPVIDANAKAGIDGYIAEAKARVLHRVPAPRAGSFVAPTLIEVGGIEDLPREIFGPVLHVATYDANALETVLEAINAKGYGLTFGLHTRIDERVQHVSARLNVGNLYVNRNQIGAVVGSQPFGGEGLSGTGPKAGGPHYVPRFAATPQGIGMAPTGTPADLAQVQVALTNTQPPSEAALSQVSLSGPTGESNRLSLHGRGVILCLGEGRSAAEAQARQARQAGCAAVIVAPGALGEHTIDGQLPPDALETLTGFDGVALWSDAEAQRRARIALAARAGPILPLMTEADITPRCVIERHLCIDTTAAGGNATLLAEVGRTHAARPAANA